MIRRILWAALAAFSFAYACWGQVLYTGKADPNARTTVPANSIGIEHSWYLDLFSGNVYGPKESGQWPTPAVATIPLSSGLLTASISLTAAQIKSSNSSPVPVVAGIPGKTILVLGASLLYTHVTTDFGSNGGGNSGAAYHTEANSGSDLLVDINNMTYYDSTHTWSQSPNNYPKNSSLTSLVGLGIDFKTDNANYPSGDGTAVFTIAYTTF